MAHRGTKPYFRYYVRYFDVTLVNYRNTDAVGDPCLSDYESELMQLARLPANIRIGFDSTLPQIADRIGSRFCFPSEVNADSIFTLRFVSLQNNGNDQRLRGFYTI